MYTKVFKETHLLLADPLKCDRQTEGSEGRQTESDRHTDRESDRQTDKQRD